MHCSFSSHCKYKRSRHQFTAVPATSILHRIFQRTFGGRALMSRLSSTNRLCICSSFDTNITSFQAATFKVETSD